MPVYAESEGRRLFARPSLLFDTEAGATCREVAVGGDRVFCAPDGALLDQSFLTFEDARCERPLVGIGECSRTEPRAVLDATGGPSCTGPRLLRIGARRAAAPVPRYSLLGGGGRSCGPPDYTETAYVFFDVGGEVDPVDIFPLLTPTEL